MTPESRYEFLAMLFRFFYFSTSHNAALRNLVYSYAVVYMDDVIIVGITIDKFLRGKTRC